MDAKQQARWEARAQILKALSHATRLMIVDELAGGPRCVAELRDLVGGDMSTVSRHLSVLKNAGILDDHKKGVQVFYRLRTPCVMDFFGCVENVLTSNIQEQITLAK